VRRERCEGKSDQGLVGRWKDPAVERSGREGIEEGKRDVELSKLSSVGTYSRRGERSRMAKGRRREREEEERNVRRATRHRRKSKLNFGSRKMRVNSLTSTSSILLPVCYTVLYKYSKH
jgi:hypothetical protein